MPLTFVPGRSEQRDEDIVFASIHIVLLKYYRQSHFVTGAIMYSRMVKWLCGVLNAVVSSVPEVMNAMYANWH